MNEERLGIGPSKKELKLKSAQKSAERTGNSKSLHKALSRLRGVEEFCIGTPHFKGEEVLLSLKIKVDIPLGLEFESNRLDKINISQLRIQTRSTRSINDNINFSFVMLSNFPICFDCEEAPLEDEALGEHVECHHVTIV